jgi:SOS-response transcriptional repressor LexA
MVKIPVPPPPADLARIEIPAPPADLPRIDIPYGLFPEDGLYLLQVEGDSMTGDGIHDGDFVIVDDARYPRDNDIVAAHVLRYVDEDGNVLSGKLLKHIRTGGEHWVLEPSNPAYGPIRFTDETIAFTKGVVIGVMTLADDGTLLRAHRFEAGWPVTW